MNYPPNTTLWRPGSLVIHDADTKQPCMLMRVTGYDRKTGECLTRYVHPHHFACMGAGVYRNEAKYLHDPKRFGIDVEVVA